MEEYLNKWIYLDLIYYRDEHQEINKLDLIHPSDIESFKENNLFNLCQCIGIKDEYLIITNKELLFRIKKEAIKNLMPNPKFIWNEIVFQIANPNIEAVILDFFWHFSEQKYFYQINVAGKKKSKRYSEDDIIMHWFKSSE